VTGILLAGLCLFLMATAAAPLYPAQKSKAEPGAPFSAPRRDAWTVIGPGGGGAQFHPAINPRDPRKILISSDMTDAFISEDGGDSWRMFNLRAPVRFFAWDTAEPGTAYAQTIGLFRTTDGGATWRLVYPDPDSVKGVIHVGDHGNDVLVTRDGSHPGFGALAIDPEDSKKLYAAGGEGGATLSISEDWGKTWKKAADLPGGCAHIYIDPESPGNDRTLYAIGRSSVSVRKEGKWTHHKAVEGVAGFTDASVGFPKGGGKAVIYAASGRGWRTAGGTAGVFVSSDGGETWRNRAEEVAKSFDRPASSLQFQAVATCLTAPAIAYVSCRTAGRDVPAERVIGVAKTSDGGKTWKAVWRDVGEKPSDNIKDPWLNDRFGPEWGENPFNLDVAATNPDICIGTDFGRTMRTTDGGKTWEGVYSRRMSDGTYSTTGIDVSCCYAVHFDPFDPRRMFISYTDIGLVASENGGSSWSSATANGVPHGWLNATYWVEFDPKVKGLVWAAMSGVHDLPRAKNWRRRENVSQSGGVVVSTDGGKSWKVTSEGLGEATVTHILLDPESPVGKRTLYACAFGQGVFKSTDNGVTWALRNDGIEGANPFCWRISRAGNRTLYLVVYRRSEDGSIGNAGDGAVYRSTDGAEHWTKIALPDGCNGPADIAVDPADAKRLCLAGWGRINEAGDTGGGVFVSSDAGKTWKNTLNKDQHIHDVTVDPASGVCYACGFESSAWRSADRGETWTRIEGYNFKWGRKIVCDPERPDMIYVATFGGSVWHGPAKGDPEAVEDIVTPQVKY